MPNDGDFCVDGLNWPDRTPYPGLIEYKKVIEPVDVQAVDLKTGRLRLANRYAFISLAGLEGSWSLYRDDCLLEQGRLPALAVAAGASLDVTLPYRWPAAVAGAEYWLNLSFTLAEDQLWAKRGLEMAWAQFKLPVETPALPKLNLANFAPLNVEEGAQAVTITGGDFKLVFDTFRGTIGSWEWNGVSLLEQGPRLNVWRAPTDNDIRIAVDWKKFGYDRMQHRIERVEMDAGREEVQFMVKRRAGRLFPQTGLWGGLSFPCFRQRGGGHRYHGQASPARTCPPCRGWDCSSSCPVISSVLPGMGAARTRITSTANSLPAWACIPVR